MMNCLARTRTMAWHVRSLAGRIPTELGKLCKLQFLRVAENKLKGEERGRVLFFVRAGAVFVRVGAVFVMAGAVFVRAGAVFVG